MLQALIAGFLLQGSLIFALGAQNFFVLESGLKKQRHFLVAAVCTLCDFVLIMVGVIGLATTLVHYPSLRIALGGFGAFFLLIYGFMKFKAGVSDSSHSVSEKVESKGLKEIILLSMGFSLLNPHAYLDLIVLIGGFSAKYLSLDMRILFGLGAAFFSMIWFFSLAYVASFFKSVIYDVRKMKMISLVSGIILIVLSLRLGVDVHDWIKEPSFQNMALK